MSPRRVVPVKLRPDVYCCKIVDINRVGRKVVKVTRLRKEDMIKYEKVKERPPPSQEVKIAEKEGQSSNVETEVECEMKVPNHNIDMKIEEVLNDAVGVNENNLDVVVNSGIDEQEKPFLSEYEETVSSNSSLALVLTDSEEDDDYDDANENDIVCNLVEGVQPKDLSPRRIVLSSSRPRREKIKFGFSKFELKNSTQNLDRFFAPKPHLKVGFKRNRTSSQTIGKDPASKGSVVVYLNEVNHKTFCDDPTEVMMNLEDLSFDTKQAEELSLQDESVQILSDEHPISENEFAKEKYEETNVDEPSVDSSATKEQNEVFTFDNLENGEKQDMFHKSNKELCAGLDESDFGSSVGVIDDPEDEFNNLFVEEGIVSAPEGVHVKDKEVDIEISDVKKMNDAKSVLELDLENLDIEEINKTSEHKICAEAAVGVIRNKDDFDTSESVDVHNLKEDLSSISLKPEDGQGLPQSPTAVYLLASAEVSDAGSVQDCDTDLPESELSTEFVLDRTAETEVCEAGLEQTIVVPETAPFTEFVLSSSTETVCEAASDLLLQSTTVLQDTELSIECASDRTATVTKEEVDNLQPCLAVWTLTARQAREGESSVTTSCLEISQVQLCSSQCGEASLKLSASPSPLFGAALESRSKSSPGDLKLNTDPPYPIQDTPKLTPTPPYPIQDTPNLTPTPPYPIQDTPKLTPTPPYTIQDTPKLIPTPPYPIKDTPKLTPTPPYPIQDTPKLTPTPPYPIQDTPKLTPTPPYPIQDTPKLTPTPPYPIQDTPNLTPTPPYPIQDTPKLTPTPPYLIQGTPAVPLTSPPQDHISELLTPSSVQLQSYLSDAIVSDMDLEVLASLGTSPDVIITEVTHVARDMENNVIDDNVKTSDSDDSDVVLLSDDETELCSPTNSLIISSWQLDILSQTWTAWPVPTQAILLHLGLETGLSDVTIRDWFKKRTDQELVRVWGELENM